MSNEQPPVRKVIPYKSGKRPSTFRKLNIDFAGTALEEALNEQEQREQELNQERNPNEDLQVNETGTLLPPVTTTPHQSPLPTSDTNISPAGKLNNKESQQYQSVPQNLKAEKEEIPPVTTSPQQARKATHTAIAPERDFNRRANSLERDALPSGLFPGSTKKVYDALYLRTIGAIVPVKKVKASRRDLLTWTGIRNLKTIDNHIRYLMAKGLIVRHWELGSNEGSSYEVRLPEEIQDQLAVPTSGGYSPPDTTSHFSGIPTTQKMGSGGEGQFIENTATYSDDKTSFNTKDIKNDDDEAFAKLIDTFRKTTKELTGREPTVADAERWRELGELLTTELRIAAARTTVSSVPAFLSEHLRRRLWKKDKQQLREEGSLDSQDPNPTSPRLDISRCPDCGGTNFYYPKGYEGGVAKCKHARLSQQENPAAGS